jgi:hypothetical protein
MALRVNVMAKNATGSTTATSAASVIAARAVLVARFDAVLRGSQEVNRPQGMMMPSHRHSPPRPGKTLR